MAECLCDPTGYHPSFIIYFKILIKIWILVLFPRDPDGCPGASDFENPAKKYVLKQERTSGNVTSMKMSSGKPSSSIYLYPFEVKQNLRHIPCVSLILLATSLSIHVPIHLKIVRCSCIVCARYSLRQVRSKGKIIHVNQALLQKNLKPTITCLRNFKINNTGIAKV